jgi:hypothetical protein
VHVIITPQDQKPSRKRVSVKVLVGLGVAACAAPVVMIAGAFTGSDDNSDGARTHRAEINGQNVRVDDPISGDVNGVAVWFHGQGGRVDTRMNEDWLNSLREQGWAVASGDLAGESWGNQAGIDAAGDLTRWAEEETGKPVRLLIAGSMGGLTSLNALAQGVVTAPCWYGTMPVLDQTTVGNVPNADAQIREAFGGEVPLRFIPTEVALPEMRYRVLASPGDTWVPKEANADRLAEIMPNGAVLTEQTVVGEHGDSSHFSATDLTQFAAGC